MRKKKVLSVDHEIIISESIVRNTNSLSLAFIEASCKISAKGLLPVTIQQVKSYWYNYLKYKRDLFYTRRDGKLIANYKN
jgi:hypothetical protein